MIIIARTPSPSGEYSWWRRYPDGSTIAGVAPSRDAARQQTEADYSWRLKDLQSTPPSRRDAWA